jgi:hypothetical protein
MPAISLANVRSRLVGWVGSGKPTRWNKGRSWDGLGDWCDALTSEEACR